MDVIAIILVTVVVAGVGIYMLSKESKPSIDNAKETKAS
jgi:septation ring formation regulator EzrA